MLISWVKSFFQKPTPAVAVNHFPNKFPTKIRAEKLAKSAKVKLCKKDPRKELSWWLDYNWAKENGSNSFNVPNYRTPQPRPENMNQTFEVIKNHKGKRVLSLKGQDGVVYHLVYNQNTRLAVVD